MAELAILDLSGRVVRTERSNNVNHQLDLSGEAAGVYTVTLRGAFANVTTALAGAASAGQTTLSVNPPAQDAGQDATAPDVDWRLATGSFGARYVVSEAVKVEMTARGWMFEGTAFCAVPAP